MTPALFLDRDGVVNVEKHYLYKIPDFEFIDGVFDCCRYFQQLGYKIIIVTNQGGIAQGFYTEEDYQTLTAWMLNQFQAQAIHIDGVYHCPHHPKFTGDCDCRKPKPGMLLQAQQDHHIDLTNSIMVGDKLSDIQAAQAAGLKQCYLIRTGHALTRAEEQQASETLNRLTDLIEQTKQDNQGD
ncbi:D-glycero-beta-D-manno-heptose 1,7-bisphosphate 7-phosphatase [Thiomicrospira microaerophila]|uniref:D-glycero-beta-D-manno-heptose 1,7-bisphosphate 7-phosphatase n=1 Tax=Thiomicrospira microaerophila TaxID=406020 RepID=UPI0005CB1F2C|nr:D-glycero-beta-D-manno-heptose 1,7-bisphosphate 7-phosphatase [Thiomicrospira microaerophila]